MASKPAKPTSVPPAGYAWKYSNGAWSLILKNDTKRQVSIIQQNGGYNDLIPGAATGSAALETIFTKEKKSTLVSKSVWKITDLLGEGPISGFFYNSGIYGSDPLTSTYFDGVRVRNLDGNYNFNLSGFSGSASAKSFEFNYTLGTSGQSGIPGFNKTEVFLPLSANTNVSKLPSSLGVPKDVIFTINKKDYIDIEGIKLTLRVPALYHIKNDGSKKGLQILYSVKARKDNGTEIDLLPERLVASTFDELLQKWNFEKRKVGAILGIANSPYLTTRPIYHSIFQDSWSRLTIRVVRENENVVSDRDQNELFVDSVAALCSNKYSYPNSSIAGMIFNSDQITQIPVRSYDLMGLLLDVPEGYVPTKINPDGSFTAASYPSIWLGNFSTNKKWTNNPAWVFYDLLTNRRYGLGNYFAASQIDKWTLYEIAKYCDEMVDDGDGGLEPRFTCNTSISTREAAYELIQDLASCFQGMTYWANGKIFVNASKTYPSVYDFTNANVIDGNFLYSDTARNTRSTVIKVKWRDPDLLFKEDVLKIEDPDGILKYGYIEKDIQAFGCTSRGLATRVANWILESERLLTETVTFQTSLEGIYLRPGDNFNIYDNFVNNKSQGGRILKLETSLTGIHLDRPVNLDVGKTYELSLVRPQFNYSDVSEVTGSNQFSGIRNPQIDARTVSSVAGSGLTFIGVNSAFGTGIQNGAIWILSSTSSGIYNDASRTFRCLAASELEPGIIEVLGVENNTGIVYRASTGYYANNINVIPNVLDPIDPPSNLSVGYYTGLQLGQFQFNYQLNWVDSPSTNLSYYQISGKIGTGDYIDIAEVNATGYTSPFTESGYYQFRLGAVSDEGVHSSYITGGILFSLTSNPLGGPPEISGIQVDYNADIDRTPTGYVNNDFSINWQMEAGEEEGYFSAKSAFFSGYKVSILNPDSDAVLLTDNLNDPNLNSYFFDREVLTGLGLNRRDTKIRLTSHDIFGASTTPIDTVFYDHPARAPVTSGFIQTVGGLNYSMIPDSRDLDLSGSYLWANESNSFIPTFSNHSTSSSETEGFLANSFSDIFYVWFSLIDNFGTGGSQIYGPVEVEPTVSIVTGIQAFGSPYLKGGVTLSGVGGVNLSQNGQTIFISGERSPFNLGFFLDNAPDETGIAMGELISSKGFVFTGYSVSCRTVGSANLSGLLYHCALDNSDKTSLGSYGLVAGQTNRTQGLPYVTVPQSRKIGYDVTSLPTDAEKISLGIFGFDVK
jgi:predicted phage tail protein